MPDDIDSDEVNDGATTAEKPLAGARLGEARRQQQITVAEVAKELHLDEYKIRALEQNQFDVLGAPVFAKGHLKKYAQLVGVKIDDVLIDYYELNRLAVMPLVVSKVRRPVRDIRTTRWIVAIILIAAVATAYWFYLVRPGAEPSNSSNSPDAQSLETGALQLPEEGIEEMQEPDPAEASDATSSAPAEVAASEPAVLEPEPRTELAEPPPSLATGEIRLALRFTGECWTEISDARGRRLFYDLGRNGRDVAVTGQAPLSVLLGNYANVSVRVNGEDYRIADSDRRGQTARLTIQAP